MESQMRQYRGLTKECNWYYGNLIVNNARESDGIHKAEPLKAYIRERNSTWISDNYDKCWTYLTFEVIPETVGQQVGLKDKNGKDLGWWKDDIVEDTRPYTPKKERLYEIVFKQGCFWLKSINGNLCLTCECLTSFLHIFNKVGNIHQHPNLMEQENDSKNTR